MTRTIYRAAQSTLYLPYNSTLSNLVNMQRVLKQSLNEPAKKAYYYGCLDLQTIKYDTITGCQLTDFKSSISPNAAIHMDEWECLRSCHGNFLMMRCNQTKQPAHVRVLYHTDNTDLNNKNVENNNQASQSTFCFMCLIWQSRNSKFPYPNFQSNQANLEIVGSSQHIYSGNRGG